MSKSSVASVKSVKSSTPAEVPETCSICCETYSNLRRKKVTCFQCQRDACVQCIKKYLVSNFDDAHCMFCRFHWSREFIDEHLSQHFRTKEYKYHRENILCEREKSRLPETQALYETVQERLLSVNQDEKQILQQIRELEENFKEIERQHRAEIQTWKNHYIQKQRQVTRLYNVLEGITDEVPDDNQFLHDAIEKSKTIMFPCPSEGCNAFLDSKLTCSQCHVKLCKNCHAIKQTDEGEKHGGSGDKHGGGGDKHAGGGDKHQCKEEDVASIKQMKKDSKNCPGCGAMIFKIDGCDQMWCTMCHTAFSWKTGHKIERGQIHNPHFYEWRRNNGGLAPGAVDAQGCPVGMVTVDQIASKVRKLTGCYSGNIIYEIHREITEINDIHLNPQRRLNWVDPTRRLRIRFLTGDLTEDQWKHELQKHEKKESKQFEILQVYQMYVGVMEDLFREITMASDVDTLQKIQDRMVSLLNYVHENLVKINSRYGSVAIPQYARNATRLSQMKAFALNTHNRYR